MFAIFDWNAREYYGPFVNEQAAHNYAWNKRMPSYAINYLRDSGDAMDYTGDASERRKQDAV